MGVRVGLTGAQKTAIVLLVQKDSTIRRNYKGAAIIENHLIDIREYSLIVEITIMKMEGRPTELVSLEWGSKTRSAWLQRDEILPTARIAEMFELGEIDACVLEGALKKAGFWE